MNIDINKTNIYCDKLKFQKMVFLSNALDNGWSIKKNNKSYIFTKKYENKKEIYNEKYLENFMKEQINIKKLLT